MIELTVDDIINNCDAKLLIGNRKVKINECFIDSKKKTIDGCFFGIKGNKTDGSLFYKEAFLNGASVCILNKIYDLDLKGFDDKTVLIADDTKKVLQQLASYKRSLFKGKVIGITGSVGKTSTKEVIYNILKSKYKVLKTMGNQNSQIGLPLNILKLKDENVMVLEMGMSNLNQIHRLSLIARPDISVITNIYDSHIEFLYTRENILKAKLEILDGMENGTLVINNDNDLLNNLKLDNKKIDIVTYGIDNKSSYMASNINYGKVSTFNINNLENLKVVGTKSFIYNALAGYVVGKIMNIEDSLIKDGINDAINTESRLEVIKLNDKITLIDDSYNASYESIKMALNYLKYFDEKKIVVLGDVLELGKKMKEIHIKIGNEIKDIDYLITIGKYSKYIKKEAVKNGIKKTYTRHFKNELSARNYIDSLLNDKVTILIKGSNKIKLCNLVNYLINSY